MQAKLSIALCPDRSSAATIKFAQPDLASRSAAFARVISFSKPHEYWCWLDVADTETDLKSRYGHKSEAVVFSNGARALLPCTGTV
jgi:hypothetical protein